MKPILIILLFLTVSQVQGQCPGACQPTSYSCGGYYQAGLCPGPSDVECCVEDTSSCPGQCLWTSLDCSGSFESGLCPGPSDVECCVPPSSGGTCAGSCQPTSYSCGGYYQAGLCPGPADVECCVEDTSSCPGQCLWTSLDCSGSFESGLCPGPSDVECCVPPSSGGGCAGICQPNSYPCDSSYEAGLCPGPSDVQCCPQSTPDCKGQCQINSLPCDGQYLVGDCPGGSDIQCCSSSGGGGGGGVVGVDVSTYVSQSSWSCILNSGYSFAIVRGYLSTGNPDSNCPSTVANAHAAGISNVGVYMFPCPTCSSSAASQVSQAVSFLRNNGVDYNVFWLDIEGPQYWTSDYGYNQAFFNGLVSQAQALGQNVGIYSSASQWNPIFGSGFASASNLPLWYADYDGSENFGDFTPFGGWSKPVMKQFNGDQSLCGAGVDLNWAPSPP